jgi:hypothetical protein
MRVPLRKCFALAGTMLLGGGLMAAATASGAQAACQLQSAGNQIKHVVYITFDNVHLRRDNPNVPSDLEQMPNLLNFILDNGTISGNHHTPLISHTAHDILSALTGVYGDRMGQPVANSFGFFRADGSVGFQTSFTYWTAVSADGKPGMLGADGKTFPAPWVPFTRAGCDVGAFSVANIEFETLPGDVRTVFGVGSPEDVSVSAALALPNTAANQAARTAPNTDYLGIAVHCAQGSPLCSGPNGRPDVLPDEPGGYTGFNALYGNINVAPAICNGATKPAACDVNTAAGHVKDVFGTTVIADAFGHPGFPSTFDPTAAESLGYAAAMLEKGIPVVYLYISDVHDLNSKTLDANNRLPTSHAFGPGEAGYVAQLKAYDQAFGAFFARLAADGITKDNTLFVVVPDENDHFVGSQPTPVGCDGVHTACNYTFASEINALINRLLFTRNPATPPFLVHSDDAPTIYITGNPAPTDPKVRTMEHDLDALTAMNPITGNVDKLSFRLADQAEMKLLHMVTASPARTPTLTMFGDDDYFFFTSGSGDCLSGSPCISVPVAPAATFAWNHGDVQQDITRTWMAMVGPGVRNQGRDDRVFSDHADVRPTMMALVGLQDSYVHEGRVLAEKLGEQALPRGIRERTEDFIELAQIFKQLNAPLGSVGRNSLVYANRSITSDDATYAKYLAKIGSISTDRDALAGEIKTVLNAAAFASQPVHEGSGDGLGDRARRLIDQVEDLANGDRDHDHDDHDHDHDEHHHGDDHDD